MKFLILIFIAYASKVPGFPVSNDQIIFRDDGEDVAVDDSKGHTKFDQLRLLDDPNVLKSDNLTKEFLFDEEAKQKLENGKFFQGDIVLMEDQLEILKYPEDDGPFGTRTGILSEFYRWPKNRYGKVIVPYIISNEYSYYEKIKIVLAMKDLQKYTCVEFKGRSNEEDYIYINSDEGCSSHLGKIGGQQGVSLQRNGCLSRGTVIHELIHSLGYDHMHSHADRDRYVQIVWNNIDRKQYDNFEKVNPKRFSNFGTSYDYYSLMHYSPTAFSKNGKRTIVPKDTRYRDVIGQRVGMSAGDAERINNMYKCFQ